MKKQILIIEKNYQNNFNSDYTEKMEELDKNFVYNDNSNCYWGKPELSIVYASPLYEETTNSQKLALNHLYWVTQYNQATSTEANAVIYNQLTAGVFSKMKGYNTLCQELDLETAQERSHIHAFHTVGYKTRRALHGKIALGTLSNRRKPSQFSVFGNSAIRNLNLFTLNQQGYSLEKFQEYFLYFIISKLLIRSKRQNYSLFLKELDDKGKPIPTSATGLLGQLGAHSQLKFVALNCGSSPFLACVYYLVRFLANMLLKNYEYRYSKYYRELEKKGDFIPVPTALSHYHFLDEAFHTTSSRLIAQELYKDFAKPTIYEKSIANLFILKAQKAFFGGLSGTFPGIFRVSDVSFMSSLYRLLQANPFNMSAQESLHWIDKCLCQEHEGFHLNLKYHQSLLSDLRRFLAPIDYLWPVNREMSLMASGGSINKAIQNNSKAFKQFSKFI